jgi:hypothetical protein
MVEMKTYKQSDTGSIVTHNGGMHPVYLASMDTTDLNIRALAETIFWSEQLKEHAQFMEMLLPVEMLPMEHERAAMYKGAFEVLFEKATQTELSPQAIKDVCMDFISQARGLVDFKRQLLDEQRSAKIHSLIWPTFLDHIAREADRYIGRISTFMQGETIPADRDDIITFWAQIMAEHSQFIAHLLDPTERNLFTQALETSETFWRIQKEHAVEGDSDPVVMDINHIIDFKTAALNGIETGKIQSIISPALADHVRREAIFFGDELRRADMEAGIQPMAA